MTERFTPVNELEELLATHSSTLGDLGVFIQRLMVSQVVVLVREDSEGVTYPLTITGVHGTPMVALFTSKERTTFWSERHEQYRKVLVVDAPWAFRHVRDGLGVAVNPGNAVGFEVAADGVPNLRRDFGLVRDGQ